MKIKAISLLLALLMLSSSLIACSETPQETEQDISAETPVSEETVPVEETEDTYVYDSLEDQDFEGYTFRIMSPNGYHDYIFAEEYTGEPLVDAQFDSKCAVENRFNIEIISVDGGNDDSNPGIVSRAVTAGDNALDMVIGHDVNTSRLGIKGYLYNMYDIPQFDFDMPWWPKNTTEALTLDGRLYAASSYISYSGLAMTRATFINKELAEEFNLEIPYDIVREGKWTFDTMYTYLEGYARDLDGDGEITEDNDQAALVAGSHSWYCIQEGADVNCYEHDDDGMIYLDIDAERIAEYIEKANKITNPSFYVRATDGMGESMFNKGRALFAFTEIGAAYATYRFGDTVYGFLPSPKLNELQEEYINCCTDRLWGIPMHIEDEQLEIVGTICEALSCSNFNIVIPAYFEVAMQARVADAPDDSEMLQIIRDTSTIAFAYTFAQPFAQIHSGTRNENVGSLLAASETKAEKSLKIFKNNLPD